MAKWWHVLATAGLAALAVATPPIQAAIAGHGVVTVVLASIWAIVGSILPSPVAPTTSK